MADLKKCFEKQGFSGVRTYINSGNVIFSTSMPKVNLAESLERCIADSFGLSIPMVVRSSRQIAEVTKQIPDDWVNDSTMCTDVLFLWPEADSTDVLHEIKTNPEVDNLMYVPGAIIWNYDRANYAKTKMRDFIGAKIYKQMTARNANMVRKLAILITTAA